jgi:glycyl-tRNA synthetase beta chain
VLEKSDRVERLAASIWGELSLSPAILDGGAARPPTSRNATSSRTWSGSSPSSRATWAPPTRLAQGEPEAVAEVIKEHYRPKGAHDATASSDAAALVALADRLDTIVACFGIGLAPTGTADPFALRRAVLGLLRTMLDRGFDPLPHDAHRARPPGARGQAPRPVAAPSLTSKLLEFSAERLRGLLSDKWPADAVRAAIAAGHDRPLDLRGRVAALAALDEKTRTQVGEVFKRAHQHRRAGELGRARRPARGRAQERAGAIRGLSTVRFAPPMRSRMPAITPTYWRRSRRSRPSCTSTSSMSSSCPTTSASGTVACA